MLRRKFLHLFLILTFVASDLAPSSFAQAAAATGQGAQTSDTTAQADWATRVAAFEREVEEKHKASGVPGAALVVIKDDKVIVLKGLGLRDAARQQAATPDTLFAIGSCTKAFTAMAAAMSADDGKLSLDDSPKKHLPYFRLRDPDADARVTLRDLLSHATGLDGTDLAWYTGVLNREEVIRVAGEARPTAKLREKYQYQNVMFSAAGEATARAQKTTWEDLIRSRILRPLGMKATVFTVREMQGTPDFSLGYVHDAGTKQARPVPTRDLTNIAPAGAINSSAREMAEWLRLMTSGGVYANRRLVSEKSFNELFAPQIKINETNSYGLGWILTSAEGRQLRLHTGGIDGFGALVVLLPEHKLGMAVLTNVQGTTFRTDAMRALVKHLAPPAPSQATAAAAAAVQAAVEPQRETGSYFFEGAGFNLTVSFKDGKLLIDVPGQPQYVLEAVEGRRYKFTNLPGYFITFRPARANPAETEAYLEQPHGNFVLPKIRTDAAGNAGTPSPNAKAAAPSPALMELVGAYHSAAGDGGRLTVELKDGRVALVVPDQPPYPLVERERDVFGSTLLPDTYAILVRRDAAGKISVLALKQPEGLFEFKRAGEAGAPVAAQTPIAIEELMSKAIAAAGGEANLRRHKSLHSVASVTFEQQGMTGEAVTMARAPNAYAHELTFIALGKKIGTTREYFDGTNGGEEVSFAPVETWSAGKLAEARIAGDFHAMLNWKTLYKSVTVREVSKVGDEEAYVVVYTPERGAPVTDYISTKTFLTLRRDTRESDASGNPGQAVTNLFADYRNVDGVFIPFTITSRMPATGESVSRIKEVKFDAPLPDTAFRARGMKK